MIRNVTAYPPEVRQHCRDRYVQACAEVRITKAGLRQALDAGDEMAAAIAQVDYSVALATRERLLNHVRMARQVAAAAEARTATPEERVA